MGRKTALVIAACVGISEVGCRSGGWDDSFASDHSETPVRRSPSASSIDGGELTATEATSLRDALMRTRPEFLRTSPTVGGSGAETAAPSVYIDGRYAGAPDALTLVSVSQVQEVRFFRPASARLTFGSFCPCAGGVIAVTTRGR